MTSLYHKEIGLPKGIESFFGKKYIFTFSTHAKQACRNDRYGFIIPPTTVTVTPENLIEVEVTDGVVAKLLIRQQYDKNADISIAFIPEGQHGFVKTLWLNLNSDKHFTLDKTKYVKP